MLEVRKRTRKLRAIVADTSLRILTPKSYKEIQKNRENYTAVFSTKYPRPSTKLIHGIYGEKPLVGVEIGTGFGENALSLLHELSIEKLYCVDPFVPYDDGVDKNQADYSSKSECTLKLLSRYKNVSFIRKDSSEAVKEICETVDFVYVDGNHAYDFVLADLENYYPIINERGVIAGHDLDWPSVRKALNDFCKMSKITPILWPPDWIIVK